jgi:flavodoxin
MLMKVLVIYDSVFGNTEQIARAIGNALGGPEDVGILRASDSRPEQLKGLKLLVVGSPTRAFRPTGAVKQLLRRIPRAGLKGVRVAAFDTGISTSDIDSSVGRFFVNRFGYAARPISDMLRKKGGELAVPPEGFFVEGVEGPLKEGEIERAAACAEKIGDRV